MHKRLHNAPPLRCKLVAVAKALNPYHAYPDPSSAGVANGEVHLFCRVLDPRITAIAKTNLILAKSRAKKKSLFISIVSVRGSRTLQHLHFIVSTLYPADALTQTQTTSRASPGGRPAHRYHNEKICLSLLRFLPKLICFFIATVVGGSPTLHFYLFAIVSYE